MKRTYMKRRPKRNPMPPENREAVWERARGRCEACNDPLHEYTWECHHRRNRGMGGTSRPEAHALSNLLALCPRCHAKCTTPADDWPREWGWTVHPAAEPARMAVFYRGTRWVLLTDDGQIREMAA